MFSVLQYFEYSTHYEIRHNIQKELCLHGAASTVKLDDCQYKGRNTFVGAEQKWELKDVSLVFQTGACFIFYSSAKIMVCSPLDIGPVILHAGVEDVSERPSRASFSGTLQPLRQIPTLGLCLSEETKTTLQIATVSASTY